MKIKNQTFAAGEVVELDGNTFEGCTFSGCHMVFRGLGTPVGFASSIFGQNITWEFAGAASIPVQFLKVLVENTGDYGKQALLAVFPSIKDWIKPEILAAAARKSQDG